MVDLYLRSNTEAEMANLLPQFRIRNARNVGVWQKTGAEYSLDPIGPLEKTPAVYDNTTGQLVAQAQIDTRFHANLRCSEAIANTIPKSLIINPDTKTRVWA